MRRLAALAFFVLCACNGIPQSEECAQYLTCVDAIMPGASSSFVGSYGENGTCWSTDRRSADNCTAACVQGRQLLASGLGRGQAACQ